MGTNLKLTAMAWTVLGLAVVSARADVTISLSQVGSNVVATGGGTLNLTDLTFQFQSTQTAFIESRYGDLAMGPTSEGTVNVYSGLTGPDEFGTYGYFLASSGSGDNFGISPIEYGFPSLYVPTTYVSGTALSATDTYSGQSLASLGLTLGTYTWTWGTGMNTDSLTVQIGPAATAVLEPSTAVVAVFGAVAFLAYGWSRHRREQPRQAAA